MRFILTIELGNDAMQTSHDVARALAELSERLFDCPAYSESVYGGRIYDDNGNRVGSWRMEGDNDR